MGSQSEIAEFSMAAFSLLLDFSLTSPERLQCRWATLVSKEIMKILNPPLEIPLYKRIRRRRERPGVTSLGLSAQRS